MLTFEIHHTGLSRTERTVFRRFAHIGPGDYAKYRALLAAITGGEPFRWKPNDPTDRLVVFTERIETLHWLQRELARDLKLRAGQLEILHGTMSDIEQQRVVEDFGNTQRPVRLLLCSDVASEGINLHFQCHRLIHFDMPWSLMVFQQRNGRVDRYGQPRTPRIVYLVTESANETIRCDTRILEVLERKDEQAYRNVGDPSAFMNVHDIREEEKVTERAIADGETAPHFDNRLTPGSNEGDDLLALFLGTSGDKAPASDEPPDLPPPPKSLYDSDLRYCEAALTRLLWPACRGSRRTRPCSWSPASCRTARATPSSRSGSGSPSGARDSSR